MFLEVVVIMGQFVVIVFKSIKFRVLVWEGKMNVLVEVKVVVNFNFCIQLVKQVLVLVKWVFKFFWLGLFFTIVNWVWGMVLSIGLILLICFFVEI